MRARSALVDLGTLSLKRRITLSVALGLVFILGIFGYVSMWAVEQSTNEIYRERQALAGTTARYIDEVVARVYQELEEVALLSAQLGAVEARDWLLSTHQAGSYSRLALLDSGGGVVWQGPAGALQARVASWPCVEKASIVRGPAASILIPTPGGRGTACVAVPLPDRSGMLVAELDPLSKGTRLIPPSGAEDSLQIEVVDETGTVVASSAGENATLWIDHMQILSPLAAGRQSGVRIHQMPEGSPRHAHLVAYAPLSSVPNWGVTVEQDQDVALALPRSLQTRMLLFGVVILVLGSVVAWVDVRRVVKPLEGLTSASARMAAGDLESPITTTRRDEVGELARTFDVMRIKLKNSLEEIGRWNQELEERVNRRTQELSALFEASHTLTYTLSLIRDERETYAQLTAKIAEMVGAAKCLIALWHEGDEVVGHPPGYGVEEGAIASFRYHSPGLEAPCIVGPGMRPAGDSTHGRRFLYAFGGDTVLTVPLQVEGKTTGIIYAADKPGGFTEHDVRLLTIVAGQAAVAVENAHLYGELQRKEGMRRQLLDKVIMAQEEERKRISRELHDDIGQALTALVMNLGGVEESLPGSQGELRGRLASIRNLASQTLVETRRLMVDLRPTLLDDLGLIPAISWYAESHLGRAHIQPRVEVAGFQGGRLPLQMETVLFRVVQEAITNIIKHSSATEATIRLELVDGTVRATIEDNGHGFEVADKVRGYDSGLGLMGMQERVSLLGGSLRIDSQPGHGTRVSLEIPLGEGGL